MLPRQLRELPADLAAVLAVVVLTNLAVFLPVVNESPLRVVVGLVFVLFVPGYAFVAALFPEAGESPVVADEDSADRQADADDGEREDADGLLGTDAGVGGRLRDRGIDGIERVALSFGLSIAIVPLIGLGLNFTPFGIRLVPILASVSLFTGVAVAVATVRRWELPEDERFRVPYHEWYVAGKTEVLEPESTTDAVLNVALALAVLLATTSVVYAVAVPPQGEQFTEAYLLTEGEDGDLVAAGYPEELVAGQPAPLHVGIGNNEHETVTYTVVVQLQTVEGEGNETTVTDRAEIDRWSVTLPHNETDIDERDIVVDDDVATAFAGEDRRLAFLVYVDDPPAEPTRENAYRDLHLWVDVEES